MSLFFFIHAQFLIPAEKETKMGVHMTGIMNNSSRAGGTRG
jgi:hypothetical protein